MKKIALSVLLQYKVVALGGAIGLCNPLCVIVIKALLKKMLIMHSCGKRKKILLNLEETCF